MTKPAYQRSLVAEIRAGLDRGTPLLHIMIGPRQTGKTTAAAQVAAAWRGEVHEAAADAAVPHGPEWIQLQWELARAKRRPGRRVLLVLDEIQKVRGWSETVKALWDRDRHALRVLLLGSSSLLVQHGLTESLAGRFLLHRCGHWSWPEMRAAFGFGFDDWIYFGGYPGAAAFMRTPEAWARYINDALVETVIARDVLQLSAVAKPALLRHLFGLAATHPAEILSYTKMLGQLSDAGNTTTLAHYLVLLEGAFLISGLEAYKGGRMPRRGSSPKLVVWNNALVNAVRGDAPATARADRAWWGRLVENAAGAHLLGHLAGPGHRVFYWRQGDDEVDYVVKTPKDLWAVEVRSGAARGERGWRAFLQSHPGARPFMVGEGGLPVEEFFARPPQEIFG